MVSSLCPARNRALRALWEGAAPTLALLADASGLTPATLARLAAEEGWAAAARPDAALGPRLQAMAERLIAKIEAIAERLSAGEAIERAELDALVAFIRALDRLGEIGRPPAAAAPAEAQDDRELGAVLQAVNDRIVALAQELAGAADGAQARP